MKNFKKISEGEWHWNTTYGTFRIGLIHDANIRTYKHYALQFMPKTEYKIYMGEKYYNASTITLVECVEPKKFDKFAKIEAPYTANGIYLAMCITLAGRKQVKYNNPKTELLWNNMSEAEHIDAITKRLEGYHAKFVKSMTGNKKPIPKGMKTIKFYSGIKENREETTERIRQRTNDIRNMFRIKRNLSEEEEVELCHKKYGITPEGEYNDKKSSALWEIGEFHRHKIWRELYTPQPTEPRIYWHQFEIPTDGWSERKL